MNMQIKERKKMRDGRKNIVHVIIEREKCTSRQVLPKDKIRL